MMKVKYIKQSYEYSLNEYKKSCSSSLGPSEYWAGNAHALGLVLGIDFDEVGNRLEEIEIQCKPLFA